MSLSADRITSNATDDFFGNTVKPGMDAQNIPSDQQDQAKAQIKAQFAALAKAVVDEITTNGKTDVSDAVTQIITAIGTGVAVATDGGANLKTTIVAALPLLVSSKIE